MAGDILDLSGAISQALTASAPPPPAARPAASAAAPTSGEPGMFDGVLDEAGKVASRFGDSAQYGAYQVLDNYATSADELGVPALAEALRSYRPEIPTDFQPAGSAFVNSGSDSYSWGHLPRAIVEQGAQLGVGLAARGAGAAAGGLVAGPGGAVAGAIGLPALAGMAQQLGPMVQERARQNGRTEPNREDWAYGLATAGGSGLLDSFGLKGLIGRGAGGVIRRAGKEFATEAAQSVVEQGGTTVNTPGGLQINLADAVGEGIIGAGAGSPVAVAGRVRDQGTAGPTAAKSEDDINLAERLRRNATESEFDLQSRDRSDTEGAFGAVASVRNEIKVEAKDAAAILADYARRQGNTEGSNILRKIMAKGFSDSQSTATPGDLKKLRKTFGNVQEVHDLITLAGQRRRLNEFLRPGGTIGGISQYTRMLDPMESKNGAFQKGVGLLSLTAGAGIPGLLVNRLAVGVDKATGRYSPVKRFVESAPIREEPPAKTMSVKDMMKQDRDALDMFTMEFLNQGASPGEARAKAQEAFDKTNKGIHQWAKGASPTKARVDEARAQTAEAGVPGAQARSAAAGHNAEGARLRTSKARDQAASSPELEARKLAAAAIRERILAHNAETAQARMTIAQAKAARAEMMEAAKAAKDTEMLIRLRRANEAQAQRELDAKNASAADKARLEAEAAKPQPIPDLNDGDRQQIKNSKKVAEYWDHDTEATETAIDLEYQAMLNGKAARHSYDLNSSQKKAAKGNAASRAISALAERLNGRDDIPYSRKSKYLDALNAMNHPEETRTNRKALMEKMEKDLGDVLDSDPDAQLALNIAKGLRDAGSSGNNDVVNRYSGPGRGFKSLPTVKSVKAKAKAQPEAPPAG